MIYKDSLFASEIVLLVITTIKQVIMNNIIGSNHNVMLVHCIGMTVSQWLMTATSLLGGQPVQSIQIELELGYIHLNSWTEKIVNAFSWLTY